MKPVDRIIFAAFGIICAIITTALIVKLSREGGFTNFLFVCVSALLTAIMFVSADKDK